MKLYLFVLLYLWSCIVFSFEIFNNGKMVPVYVATEDVTTYSEKELLNLESSNWERLQTLTQQFALDDMQKYLRQMTGVEVKLHKVSDVKEVQAPAIVIGRLARELGAVPTKDNYLQEGFCIKADEKYLLIAGNGFAGTGYGIYDVLYFWGCDWVMPGIEGESIPEGVNNLAYPNGEKENVPVFIMRTPWLSGGIKEVSNKEKWEFTQWKLRQKMQGGHHLHPESIVGVGHVWMNLIKQNKAAFDAKPELYALRQHAGTLKRRGPQIETTAPETIAMGAEYVRDIFKRNKWPNDKRVNIGLGPSDGTDFSESPESLAAGGRMIDPMTGELNSTELVVKYLSDVLKSLKNEFSNLRLGYYIYSTHSEFPRIYTLPKSHMALTVADINYSRLHGTHDKSSKSRTYFRYLMENWIRIAKETDTYLYFYGYNWNLADNFLPTSKLKAWGEDFPWLQRNGFRGYYNECSQAWAVNGPHDYLLAQLSWDPTLDWKQVLKKYCVSAFGKEAAPFMESYYLCLVETQSNAGQEAGSYYSFNLIFNDNFIKKSEQNFASAAKLAETELQKKRIAYAAFPVAMLKRYFAFRTAYCNFDFVTAEHEFYDMINDLKAEYEKNPQVTCISARNYLKLFLEKFILEAKKYSTGDYKIVYKIPDRLCTMIDSTNTGQLMGFFEPEVNDSMYFQTATYSATADAQGLGGFRGGSTWYRHHFSLPENLKGKFVGLFIGGACYIVNVWVDGNYIGRGEGFSTPFIFDLSKVAKPGEKQLIALQVMRPKNEELGIGGLTYPSFFFTGKEAPSNVSNERKEELLPGGAVR